MNDPEFGGPMPPSDKPGLAERYVRWVENRAGRRAGGSLLGLGLLMLVVGGWIWLHFSTVAHECSSGLVYALDQSQCSSATTWHSIGGIAALTGIVLLIIRLVRR